MPVTTQAQTASPLIPLPQPFQFQQINIHNNGGTNKPFFDLPHLTPAIDNPVEERNRKMLEQHGMLPGPHSAAEVQQMADVERDVMEMSMNKEEMEWMNRTKSYREAFGGLSRMNPDSFSLVKAVYQVENAYWNGHLPFASFDHAIQERADLVRQILRRNGLDRTITPLSITVSSNSSKSQTPMSGGQERHPLRCRLSNMILRISAESKTTQKCSFPSCLPAEKANVIPYRCCTC